MKLFGPLYERVLGWSAHPRAESILAALSFAESSFFPVPPDVMLAPMCLARPPRAFRLAAVTTIASTLGGVLGYAIGYFLFDALEPWLRDSHYWSAYLTGRTWFDEWGVWAVFLAGFSPIPYKIFTIAAGVAVLNPLAFLVASFVGRGARFYLVAGLVRAGGVRMAAFLPRYIERIGWSVVAIAVLLGLWAAYG